MELFRVIRIIFFSDIRFLLKFQWFRGKRKLFWKLSQKSLYSSFYSSNFSRIFTESFVTWINIQIYDENFEGSSGLLDFSSSKKKKKMKKYFLSKTGRESRQKFRSVPFCFNEYNNLKFEFLKRFREGWPLDS